MKPQLKKGVTSTILQIFIRDSSSVTGAGLTGLAFGTASLTAYYHRGTDTTATVINLVTMTVGTFTSSGFKEIDATNMPGWYQFCPPDAALATGANNVSFHLKGATNMAPLPVEVQLVSYDPYDSVRLGLTAMPNAAASAVGGLPVAVDTSGRVDVLKINGTSQTARDIGASVLLSSGTGTGQLDFTSGIVKSNLTQILGTLLTETAGQIAAGFKAFFNVAAPVLTVASVNQTGDNYARIGVAGAGLTALGDARLANLDAAVSTRLSDKTGYSLTSAEHTLIVADANAALDTAGTEQTSIPGPTGTTRKKINAIFQYLFYKRTTTQTTETLYKSDSVTVLGTATVSDDGITATHGRIS